MKKRLYVLILTFVVLLAACAPSQDLATIFAPGQPPILGSWEGNVFTSEYLGLRIEMPDGWVAFTDEELAERYGFNTALLESRQDLWELVDTRAGRRVPDMEILSPNFASAAILYERFYTAADQMMSSAQFNQFEADLWNAFHDTITISDTPVRIGNLYWYYFDGARFFAGLTHYGRHFQRVQDGFGMSIYIQYFCSDSETLEEVMAMFSPL